MTFHNLQASQSQRDERQAACLQRGDVTAEAGAGIYFAERRALAEALHHLLQMEAMPDADAPADIQTAVKLFVESLLSQMSGGRSTLITRLIELIGVSTLTLICCVMQMRDSSLQHHPSNTCVGEKSHPERNRAFS